MIYSFKVTSLREVDVPQHFITIGKGLDTFTVRTDDVDALKDFLLNEGVSILECNQIDDLEPVEPQPEVANYLQGGLNERQCLPTLQTNHTYDTPDDGN